MPTAQRLTDEERLARDNACKKRYAETHRDEINARNRLRRAQNLEASLERERAERERNRLARRAASRTYRRKHAAVLSARAKAQRQANLDAIKARERAQYAKNREQRNKAALVRKKRQRLLKPELPRACYKRYRANKLNAPVNDFTAAQWRDMKEHYEHRCVYCGKKTTRLTQDHIIPLSKEGAHTRDNIVPACKPCNSRKGTGAPLVPVQPMLVGLT